MSEKEQEKTPEAPLLISNELFKSRTVTFFGEMKPEVSEILAKQLLALAAVSDDPIKLYINSPGGLVSAGLAIYDTMQYIKPSVSTLCVGQAASMGSLLLAAGEKGKRFCLPNSRIMIHQPLGGFQGQASDIEIHAKEILFLKGRLNEILAKHSGQSIQTIGKDTDRDNFLSAEDSVKYGLVDEVLTSRTKNTT